MASVQLIHWNAAEAEERAGYLRASGYEVRTELPPGPELFRRLRADPPLAVVIDLGRLPSQGRDVALTIRRQGATRHVPLILVGGDPDKVARIRELLPDAVYTRWEEIGSALEQALAHPPSAPVVPQSSFAAYAGKPLATKLGIKAGTAVALVGAPQGFREALGELPAGVTLGEQPHKGSDLTLWFVRSRTELEDGIANAAAQLERGALWIVWPKRASRMGSDLSQQQVREAGLAAGLVDYKICSVDDTWSGLLFTRRGSGTAGSR